LKPRELLPDRLSASHAGALSAAQRETIGDRRFGLCGYDPLRQRRGRGRRDGAVRRASSLKGQDNFFSCSTARIFQEGYVKGREDALQSLKEEIERETKSAYAKQVLDDESARSAAVAAEAEKLARKFPK
jgi:hypothetical protein